jgi:hypothetical protein
VDGHVESPPRARAHAPASAANDRGRPTRTPENAAKASQVSGKYITVNSNSALKSPASGNASKGPFGYIALHNYLSGLAREVNLMLKSAVITATFIGQRRRFT